MKNDRLPLRVALAASTCLLLVLPASAQEPRDENGGEPGVTRLSTIVVTKSDRDLKKALSPGEVSIVYPDDTKGEHKSLPDLLDQIPGVYVRRVAGTGQYTTASIRGSAPSQVNIFIDGVPYNTASESATDLSTIPMSNVARVEVYRGTTPARFSGAPLGGAINIVTKHPDKMQSSISSGMRSYGGYQASMSTTMPLYGGTLMLGLDGEKSEGDFKYDNFATRDTRTFKTPNTPPFSTDPDYLKYPHLWTQPGEGIQDWADFGFEGWLGKDNGYPVRRQRMNNNYEKTSFLAKWQDERFFAKYSFNHMKRFRPEAVTSVPGLAPNNNYTDIPGASFETSQKRRQYVDEHNFAAGWRESFDDLTLGLSGTFMDQTKRYKNLTVAAYPPNMQLGVGSVWTDYHTRRYGIAGDLGYDLTGTHLSHRFEIHTEQLWEMLDVDANNRVGAGGSSDLFTDIWRNRTVVQGQDTMTVHALDDLELTPILRFEKMTGPRLGSRLSPLGAPDGDYDWQPTYGLSAKKEVFGGFEVFSNIGTYNRWPTFYEIYGDGAFVSPGTDSTWKLNTLKREHGYNFDAGIGWTGNLWDEMEASFRLTYFQRRADDTITFYATPVGSKYMNTGSTLTKGVELESNLAFSDRWDMHLAATFQEGEYVKGTYYAFGGYNQAKRVTGKLQTLQNPNFAANARINTYFLDRDLTLFAEVKHTGKINLHQVPAAGADDHFYYEKPLTTIDIGGKYNFGSGFSLTAGVTDLFNRGPKQQQGGHPDFVYNDQGLSQQQTYSYSYQANVNYPKQGRTFYMTLGKTF